MMRFLTIPAGALVFFCVSCAQETVVTEGPRRPAARTVTETSRTETIVEEPAPVQIEAKPPRPGDSYLPHDG